MKKKFNLLKKSAVVLTLALAIGTSSIPALPVNATSAEQTTEATSEAEQKKSTPYMQTLKKAKFDLKKNKKVTYYSYYKGIGNRKESAKITGYKIMDAEKEGYKKLKFSITFKPEFKLSKSEVDKRLKDSAHNPSHVVYTVLDYNTGISLERPNDKGVDVKCSWKQTKKNKYYGSGSRYYWIATMKAQVTITYPEDYDGLCVGIGGCLKAKESKADKAYWKGRKPFGEATRYYSKKKTNFHFMRITK